MVDLYMLCYLIRLVKLIAGLVWTFMSLQLHIV